jgi:dihydroorotate dehydrogenase electron transfer subunit
MDYETRLFNKIARSHMYWGRKPLAGLRDALSDLGSGQVLFDPFCGGGSAAIVALNNGARVIASDLNPMAVFLTQVLLRPINLRNLGAAFDFVRDHVAEEILKDYSTKCPKCRGAAVIEDIIWQRRDHIEAPVRAKILCKKCGIKDKDLSEDEAKAQVSREGAKIQYWYPRTYIKAYRKPLVKYHYQLFSGRNLRSLAALLNMISKIEDIHCRDALKYVFTAMLYSCSKMQMYTKTNPRSSRGWYACRYYLPPMWKEKNVWLTFENRFNTFLVSKNCLNQLLPHIRVTTDPDEFVSGNTKALVLLQDAFNPLKSLANLATHVFLDPPYNDDIEYFAFSEFWGVWLKMQFDFENEWKSREMKALGLQKILSVIHDNTQENCSIALALEPKVETNWQEDECITKSGYYLEKTVPFFYNNSNKRGFKKKGFKKKKSSKKRDADNTKGRFLLLRKITKEMSIKEPQHMDSIVSSKETAVAYLRVAAFLFDVNSPEAILERALYITPDHLKIILRIIPKDKISKYTKSRDRNRCSYFSLCIALLERILQEDGWQFEYINHRFVDGDLYAGTPDGTVRDGIITQKKHIPFIAVRDDKRILFFFDEQHRILLKTASENVEKSDNDNYKTICVLISRGTDKMNELRKKEHAADWPRGFFVSFDELWDKYCKLTNNDSSRLIATYRPSQKNYANKDIEESISTFEAKINEIIQVGGPTSSYYKIRFQAPDLERIVPGQFVMIDTQTKHLKVRKPPIALDNLKASIDLTSTAYLKRPFGIHRALYEGFKPDYLKHFSPPPHMSTIMHTVRPNQFDILFKVLPNGIGTNELSKLKPNDRIQMIGPLGKRISVRELRNQGYKEVHVIGGGVGMAPLIFLVQALKFYAFRVKAFVGIESLEILKHSDRLAESYVANFNDVKIYLDDLIAGGLHREDIFVSSDKKSLYKPSEIKHYYTGFVSKQYETYLNENGTTENVIAFTCGPEPMMREINNITQKHQIPLKVLVEKRMACGIGVCLSCVCRTRENGNDKYARVCTEGPVFDASEIVWKK